MTTLYTEQYEDQFVDNPPTKVMVTDDGGRMRVKYCSITTPAVVATTDVIKACKLPAGARLHQAVLKHADLGTAGDLNVGWAANGTDAAAADGIFAAADVNAAAGVKLMTSAHVPGVFKKFAAETEIQIVPSEATTVAGLVELALYYSLD